jgi:leucyl-tRNA synthetase
MQGASLPLQAASRGCKGQGVKENTQASELKYEMNRAVKKVTEDLEEFHFNTAIAAMMEYINFLFKYDNKNSPQYKEAIEILLIVLSPFAPHICEELWYEIGKKEPIFKTTWPSYDATALKKEDAIVVVQINGKLRGRLSVPIDIPQEEAEKIALADKKVLEWLGDKEIKKIVYVKNKILNVVVG